MGKRPTALLGSLQPCQKLPEENTSSSGELLHGVVLLLCSSAQGLWQEAEFVLDTIVQAQLSQLEEHGPPRVLETPFSEGKTQNICFRGLCEQAALVVVTANAFCLCFGRMIAINSK